MTASAPLRLHTDGRALRQQPGTRFPGCGAAGSSGGVETAVGPPVALTKAADEEFKHGSVAQQKLKDKRWQGEQSRQVFRSNTTQASAFIKPVPLHTSLLQSYN